jgi:hypothetical protein
MNLTYNNYYTSSGNGDDWKIHLEPCTQKATTYYAESIRAANLIAEASSKQIVLMFSGGIDSEFMLNVFKVANCDFKVAIISYGKWNKHDAKYAFEYCKTHGIKPDVIEIDLEKFITSGLIYDIAEKGNCSAYQMTSVMYAIEQIDGSVVMANCEPQINLINKKWMWDEPERTNSYRHWYSYVGLEGTPDFPRYTPEQTVSFLEDPLVKQLVNNELGYNGSKSIKHSLYNQHFNIAERPKFTGWEYIERSDFFNSIYSNFGALQNKFNGQCVLEYNDVLQQLKGKFV